MADLIERFHGARFGHVSHPSRIPRTPGERFDALRAT
jgi:hypothetical protein